MCCCVVALRRFLGYEAGICDKARDLDADDARYDELSRRARAARQLVVPRVVRVEVPRLVTYPRLVAEETPERNNAATHRRITTMSVSNCT